MRTAEGSSKTAVENQQNIGSAFEIGELHTFTQEIFQDEIRSRGIDGDLWHWNNRKNIKNSFFSLKIDETLIHIH